MATILALQEIALMKATALLYNDSQIQDKAECLYRKEVPDEWYDLIEAKVSTLRLPKVLHEKLIIVADDACQFLGFFFKTHTKLQRYRGYNCYCLNGIIMSRYLRTNPKGFFDEAKTAELIARDRRIDSLFRYLLVRDNGLDRNILEPPMNKRGYIDERFLRWAHSEGRIKWGYSPLMNWI
ncbi:hypothetical protein AVEN_94238-1 [Araneus ventricosus]|uniref:Uncharacterized protein n=1 Tax=Araneus ventricosus TaxID=182803 RepID=A0A4Y2S2I3_ARAVE|nr:hypothetical protein AVEN_94238-1 [Araneus ventricosus]